MGQKSDFVFGIYPGGEAGSDEGQASGPPDNSESILRALVELQGSSRQFIVRAYERFSDVSAPSRYSARTPVNYDRYLGGGRRLDLVVMFQSAGGDVDSFLAFLRDLVQRYAPSLYTVQVTEEANFTDGPDAIDGPYPRVREALVRGVCATSQQVRELGYEGRIEVGFSTTPMFGPAPDFCTAIGELGGGPFREALDYVALDFFPDVFRRLPADGEPGDVRDSVHFVIRAMRAEWLRAAGIPPSVPIHIGENGWPTGPDRPYERQAEVLETIIRTVHSLRTECNIERYTMFDLRDADSEREGEGQMFYQFGLMRDDYTPKPAFETYRRLIAELGLS